jgi:acyl carrier protein
LYKTGDLGRWTIEGNIEFLGRKDDQVKIRGYRIELGEIEHALKKLKSIEDVLVVPKIDTTGYKSLTAFIISNENLILNDLRQQLKLTLPDYMIPGQFLFLKAFPLTQNGKVDKRKLMSTTVEVISERTVCVEPRTEIERKLIEIWRNILKVEELGIDHDFFALGGDSMKAVQTSVACNEVHIEITTTDIYNNNSIRKLAGLIENGLIVRKEKKPADIPIPDHIYKLIPIDVDDVYPVSDMQRIMIEEYEKDKDRLGIYHSVSSWRFVDENLSIAALEKAIMVLYSKNHVLRTVLFSDNKDLYQCIKHVAKKNLIVDDISSLSEIQQNKYIEKKVELDIKNKFSIGDWNGSLVRFTAFVLSKNKIEFMMSFHHAIIDGWGDTVFQNELLEYYLNYRDNKPVAINDVPNAFKEHILLCKEVSASDRASFFWKNELKDWKLFSKKRHKLQDNFSTKIISVDQQIVIKLKKKVTDQKVTLKSIFLTEYIKTLGNILKTNYLSTGVVYNGRTTELSDPLKCMGLFWNILPLYFDSIMEISYRKVQEKLNKGEEFARFSAHRIKQQLGHDPNFTCFNYIHFHNTKNLAIPERNANKLLDSKDNEIIIPELIGGNSFEKYHYPLNIFVAVDPFDTNKISIRVEYNHAFFSDQELDDFLTKYIDNLEEN